MATDKLYVQYGCGWCAPEGWLNFDASPTLRFERIPFIGQLYTRNEKRFPRNLRYGDIVKGLPVAANAAHGVFASHVLEHLSYEDACKALRNTIFILKPAGVFRAVVPDMEGRTKQYLSALENGDPDACNRFVRSTSMGMERRNRSLMGFFGAWLGNSAHLWMWDRASLGAALEDAGFVGVRECSFGDAKDPMFRLVEDKDRFVEDGMKAVALEGRKPG